MTDGKSLDGHTLWLDFLLLSIKRYIHRYGYRMVQTTGTLSALFISIEEARELLGTRGLPNRPPPPALNLPPPDVTESELAARRAELSALSLDGPLGRLRACFDLSERQLHLFLAAVGPLVSTDLARLYSFCWADFSMKQPSVGFLTEIIGDHEDEGRALQEAFLPDAPLVRYRLLELRDVQAWGTPSPLLHKGVVVPDPVLDFLRGAKRSEPALPLTIEGMAHLHETARAPGLDHLFLADRVRTELNASIESALETGRPRMLLVGPDGVGRTTALAGYAAQKGWGVVSIDLERVARTGDQFTTIVSDTAREALLRRCILVLEGDEFFAEREMWERHMPVLTQLVNRHNGPVAFTANTPVAAVHRTIRDLFDINFPLPTPQEQEEVWERALVSGSEEEKALAPELRNRFSLSPGTIHDAVREARARSALAEAGAPLTVEGVARAVRRRLDHALSQVAEPFTTTLEWDDVILEEEVMSVLHEIISQAKFREAVYDGWGFRRKMAYGRGLSCLFLGPPGTGKTMVTALIAKSLGRELYRVDLSRIISKWVGETEKNLARVFDEAEKAQVILLFDEADALFGSRTEVKGSNDRFANMEINYLLQRMESFDGMSLLTTNFFQGIDDAFKRRLKFRVDFPLPDAGLRARLWKSMIPSMAETDGDLRFEYLGKRFSMAGGNIKNAVLRAAFYAAEAGTAISAELLERAAKTELREMGRLFS